MLSRRVETTALNGNLMFSREAQPSAKKSGDEW
jgi:hypothetical protein